MPHSLLLARTAAATLKTQFSFPVGSRLPRQTRGMTTSIWVALAPQFLNLRLPLRCLEANLSPLINKCRCSWITFRLVFCRPERSLSLTIATADRTDRLSCPQLQRPFCPQCHRSRMRKNRLQPGLLVSSILTNLPARLQLQVEQAESSNSQTNSAPQRWTSPTVWPSRTPGPTSGLNSSKSASFTSTKRTKNLVTRRLTYPTWQVTLLSAIRFANVRCRHPSSTRLLSSAPSEENEQKQPHNWSWAGPLEEVCGAPDEKMLFGLSLMMPCHCQHSI